jgi:hypothetical protein
MSGSQLSEIADRVQCLTGLLTRAQVEEQLATGADVGQWATVLDKLASWMERESLADKLTDDERALLTRPVGSWPDDAVVGASWRIEALAVLLWAMSRLDPLPALWAPAVADDVWSAVPLFATVDELLDGVSLRADDEVDRVRRGAGVWRWRARTELLHRAGVEPDSGEAYDVMVRRAADRAVEAGLVPNVIDGDFGTPDAALRDLDDEALRALASATLEREHAVVWLKERGDWDEHEAKL